MAITPLPQVAIILAGGRSTRMGKDKARLQKNEQSMLRYIEQVLMQANLDSIIISANVNYPTNFPTVADEFPDKGPIGGFHASIKFILERIGKCHCVVVPVDMPFLNTKVISLLLSSVHPKNKAAYFQRSPLPCAITIDKTTLSLIERMLENNEKLSIYNFLSALNAEKLVNLFEHELTNTNTPEEWSDALKKTK